MSNNEHLSKKLGELKSLAERERLDISEDISRLEAKLKSGQGAPASAWRRVELARHPNRPVTLDYIERIFNEFIELHGDRYYGDDPAIVGGIAKFGNQPVTVFGHQKGRNMKENLKRNYGMAQPEGYRKALRLAKQAEKFGRPIISFIDTQGAFPGVASEERGISEAIARNLKEFSSLKVPVICFIIGEGGSGGALGIAIGDEVYMLENAWYSVITPEGCASILFRDASKAKQAAEVLKMTAPDLLSYDIVDGVIYEPVGGAHTDPDFVAAKIKLQIADSLSRLMLKSPQQLVRDRSMRLQRIGVFAEAREKRQSFLRRLFGV